MNTDSDSQGVSLQTAFVTAINPQYPSQKVDLRLILDSGSQRSYVSTRVRNMLQLPTIKREDIIIKTFGQMKLTLRHVMLFHLASTVNIQNFILKLKP